jgi:hypothetical protein
VAIFVHLCEMFVGVAACTSLFCQFFVLVRSRKGKDHLDAYYFQTRSDPTAAYIATIGGARWENWRNDWVIASVEANDRLALPNDGPRLNRSNGAPNHPLHRSSSPYWTRSRNWWPVV